MAQWEYLRANENELEQFMQHLVDEFVNHNFNPGDDCLNLLGFDGWEMVSAVASPKFNGLEFIFKRESLHKDKRLMNALGYRRVLKETRDEMLSKGKKKFDVKDKKNEGVVL